ncbi:hypothetical protein ACFYY2_12340 [Streptomyces sp. NPDC001822]|uniref:hypothetical protein n=1 Tax=Streptomyces sp. NPDC001822 TaxID=3364614 RepID=UPI0036992814
MTIKFGDFFESRNTTLAIHAYKTFISFDLHEDSDSDARILMSNISVAEAKKIRGELDTAIKEIEETAK